MNQQDIEGLLFKTKKNVLELRKRLNDYSPQNTLRERLLEGFKVVSDWTIGSASCTLAQNTTTFKSGTSALEVTPLAQAVNFSKNVTWDLSGDTCVELRAWVADKTQLSSIYLYIYDGSGFFYKSWSSTTRGQNGWNVIRLHKSQFNTSGSPNWNHITKLEVNINCVGGNRPVVIIDSLKANIKEAANFCFIFDAGFTSQYTLGKAKLDSYGYKACVAPNVITIGAAGKMTLPQLQDVYAQGWDVLNHGANYVNPVTYDDYLKLTQDVQAEQKYLIDNGITKGVDDIYIYPIQETTTYNKVLKDLGFKLARNSVGAINYYNSEDYLNLQGLPLGSTSVIGDISTVVDNLALCGGLVLFYCHDIIATPAAATGANCTQALFEQVVDYVASKGSAINVVTMTQWYKSLFK